MTAQDANPIRLAELALRLHEQPTEQATVEAVLGFSLSAVKADFAGIVFFSRSHGMETVATTDPLVEKLDRLQLEAGQGPDLDMLADRVSVLVTDTRTEGRWPEWARAVSGLGVRSHLGVRLYTSRESFGTLNVFARSPEAFTVEDQQTLHVIARHAAVALSATRQNAHLWKGMDSRKIIGQAQGILMERYDLDGDRAFAVLMRYSQHRNVKLRDIAQELIDRRTLPDLTT
ncbi:GAF and ANTAR domain-containing protein [Marmoricola sp. RAF53]|uniref:GAF and ANTAR domain-containing protein n=1 Tax=Marmoricola sp. RAF53 TaxID=3233059 RepID=UPI003F97CD91